MPTLLITHAGFHRTRHRPGPPGASRQDARGDQGALDARVQRLTREQAPLRDDAETYIRLAHPGGYFDALHDGRPAPGEMVRIDADTVMSPGSWEAVMRAVSAGMRAVDVVLDDKSGSDNVFCQVRPPGHHAEAGRAMGFCLFNSIAVARPLCAGKTRRQPRGGRRLRRSPRQRHAGYFLVEQGLVLRFDAPDAALSGHRSAWRDRRRRQYL